MNRRVKQDYIVLSNGTDYRVFKRQGKDVPFEAYNEMKHLGIGSSPMEAINNSDIPMHLVEKKPYEVVYNEF